MIADLTAGVHSCRSFTVGHSTPTVTYGHLTAVQTPGLADEAVLFRLTQTVKDHKTVLHPSPAVFTAVRSGKLVAAFYTTTPDGAGQDLTHDVIQPQTDQLKLPLD